MVRECKKDPKTAHPDNCWKESTWPQRYMDGEDVNFILTNGKRYAVNEKHWTLKEAILFTKWADFNTTTLPRGGTLYRGSPYDTPLLNNDSLNSGFVSTSMNESIAKEFMWKKNGFLHILHLAPGCRVVDLRPHYGDENNREEEVLISPAHNFDLVKKYKHRFHWNVTPPKKKSLKG
jgi:hypothetical protein